MPFFIWGLPLRACCPRGQAMKNDQGGSEYGGAILEYIFCLLILMMFLWAVIGIFQMVTTRMLTDYAAYTGARAHSRAMQIFDWRRN